MSSDSSDSSLSESGHLSNYSGLVSSVHVARQPKSSQTYKSRDQEPPSKSRKTGQIQLLTEVEEELDYNEELPSLKRDTVPNLKSSLSSYLKSRSREPHLQSPREEGEEDSDDDDNDNFGTAGQDANHPIPARPQTSGDREEGEASSDDDHQKGKLSNTFTLDEAEYRHRLHERHKRRQRERQGSSTTAARSQKVGSYTHEQSPEFVRPRPQQESGRMENVDKKRSSSSRHSVSKEAEGDVEKRKKSSRAESSDQDFPRSSKARSDKAEHKKRSHKSSSKQILTESVVDPQIAVRSDSIHRSYSASVMDYETLPSAYASDTLASSSVRLEPSVDQGLTSRKSKSKKTKHDRPEDTLRKRGKREKLVESMDYSVWESYGYGSVQTNSSTNIRSEVITTSPRSSRSRSRSSSSSSSSSMSSDAGTRVDRLRTDFNSGTRSLSSKPTTVPAEDPIAVYGKHDSRHRYRRDTRESAPPPESGRSKAVSTSDSLRKTKTEKHKFKPVEEQNAPVSKHGGLHSKDRRITSKLSSDDESEVDAVKSRVQEVPRHKRSHIASHEPSGSSQEETFMSKKLKHHRSNDSPNSPVGKPEPMSSSPEGSPPDVAGNHGEEGPALKSSPPDRKEEEVKPIKPEPRPTRLQHYRLYSSSESSDNMDDANDHDIGADEMDHISSEPSTLFSTTTPLEVYEVLDSRQPSAPSKPYYFPSIQGCRSVEEFECLNRIEEGTYGVVYRARDRKTNEIVALKRLKMEKERDGFPITSLREINTLMKAQHENIVTVREVVVGSNMDKIYLVMDYVEHDMKALMEVMNGPFSVGEVKCLLVQLLKAVKHLHDNWILHRDLKTSNLLLSHQGILKVGDFGLAREYGSPLKHYTEVVVTLWYRAPELLLGTKQYTCPIDLWSVGCIFAEFLLQRPLFPGKGEVDELNIIFRDLGTPNERIWPGVMQLPGMKKCAFTEYPYNQLRRRFTEKQISDQGFDLLNSFLTYCPEKRITAEKALKHAYFNERPRAIHPSMFPSWPARSEGGVAVRKNASPRPPAGGGALAAAAAAAASAMAAASVGSGRVRYQPPAPPMGGQRFYSSMGPDSRPGTRTGSGDMVSGSVDKGFLLRF